MPNLSELSQLVEGQLKGDPGFEITSVNSLQKAGPTEIAFSIKDNIDTGTLRAGALVVSKKSPVSYPNLVHVDEPYLAFAKLLEYFFPHHRFNPGIDADAAKVLKMATGIEPETKAWLKGWIKERFNHDM